MKKLVALTAVLCGAYAYGDSLEIAVTNLASHKPAINGIAPGSLIYIQPEFLTGRGIGFHFYNDLIGLSLRIRPAGTSSDREVTMLPPGPFQLGLTAVLPIDLP